jgi:hypothetical protein
VSVAHAFDAVVVVDASALGWGAIVAVRGEPPAELQAAWAEPLRHSAQAEPTAVCRVLGWLRANHPAAHRVAVATDHSALWSSQRDPLSRLRGFSTAGALNSAHLALQRHGECVVFFVAGAANPADGPSRSVVPGSTLVRSRPFLGVLPPLASFLPPRPPTARAVWQV